MSVYHSDHKSIIAISTAPVTAALGIIRLSGSLCLSDLFPVVQLVKKSGPIEPRRCYRIKVADDQGCIIEDGMSVFFAAPASFTGENIIELQLHGNPYSLELIVDLLLRHLGDDRLRLAKEGEFSFRALCNGKLSLSQAEGLKSLLDSQSQFGLRSSMKMLHGEFANELTELYQLILDHRVEIEIAIDFADDVGIDDTQPPYMDSAKQINNTILGLKNRSEIHPSHILHPQVVLYGDTNSGKSSIFNKLLMSDRSIVSPIAGTTRDYVSANFHCGTFVCELHDTAGIREQTEDPIELEGIKRVRKLLSHCFCKVFVCHVNSLTQTNNLLEQFPYLALFPPDVVVITHTDIHTSALNAFDMSCWDFLPQQPVIHNCHNADFQQDFRATLVKSYQLLVDIDPLVINRHRKLIKILYSHWQQYYSLVQSTQDMGVISSELQLSLDYLTELIGNQTTEDVLTRLFSSFCIGK